MTAAIFQRFTSVNTGDIIVPGMSFTVHERCPMSELPLNEWIVIFYPQTGATRLCPTLDFAYNHLKTVVTTNLYKSPNDFRVKHDHAFLEQCWRTVHERHSDYLPKTATGQIDDHSYDPPDCGTEEFVKLLWQLLQDVGERLSVPNTGGSKNDVTATKENYEFKLGLMSELIFGEDFKNTYNNQARIVFQALWEKNEQFLDEDQIKKLIYTLVANRQLKTRQKPWVVFQYYRPQFIKDGFIIRGKRRVKRVRA
jgi:hypothetical protein